jgi:hypothetical protein
MVAIRNLYWTERIAAFIVGGLIWLARCVRSSARRRGVSAPQGLKAFCSQGFHRMAAGWLRAAHIGATFCAFAVLLIGLFALAIYPIVGVLLAISGMALLLYGVAGLCRTQVIPRNIVSESDRE